ncbi:ABC transporter ATP-binding protein [Candidatus Accumulibacter phosphatis]|jgi:putative ABC transport system ATP-binding protein|uniref:ABC transporter ATP-binding protein n=2 Tax=Candidatus Accumulibacter phosphatis TaxID=327160 RepID=A0ABX1TSS4_9PROT|nr:MULTISPECIES: ABC transporter ATP-binding protein [Candidatus Accumulibacter]NMQ27255.1 ABC transporter ATP-binding protein [Candidatus Accumulibacter phosphatis]
MPPPLIRVAALGKSYATAAGPFAALGGIDLSIEAGEFVAIMGQSGSGKSTLMNVLGCLDTPTSGDYFLLGRNVAHLGHDELAALRNRSIGFVFQGFNLLQRMTLTDNVALPLVYAGVERAQRRLRAQQALDRVGLAGYFDSLPSRISGGQQQRVAIARAVVNSPALILADEPTGNLDSHTSEEIMDLFSELNRAGITIVLVTHEADIAAYARRQVRFLDGLIVSDVASPARALGEC